MASKFGRLGKKIYLKTEKKAMKFLRVQKHKLNYILKETKKFQENYEQKGFE